MTDQEIDEYIHSEYIYDKAGSYAIQGSCCKYIKGIMVITITLWGFLFQQSIKK